MGLKNTVLKENCKKMHKIPFHGNNFQGITYIHKNIVLAKVFGTSINTYVHISMYIYHIYTHICTHLFVYINVHNLILRTN